MMNCLSHLRIVGLVIMLCLCGCSSTASVTPTSTFLPTPNQPTKATMTPSPPATPSLDLATLYPETIESLYSAPIELDTKIPSPPKSSSTPALNMANYYKIAFTYRGGKGHGIMVINADGSDPKSLTGEKDWRYFYEYLAWSPDGRWIAFSRSRMDDDSSSQILVMRADGSGMMQVTSGADIGQPAWSPDSQRILFTENVDKQPGIYVINRDGTGKKAVIISPLIGGSPAWSPDGRMIAYLHRPSPYTPAQVDSPFDIYVMDADGTNSRTVIDGIAAWDSSLAWSPDSQQIVFRSYTDCTLYTINFNGDNLRILTDNPWSKSNPAWSPDGKYIVYDSYSGWFCRGDPVYPRLSIVAADGSGDSPIQFDSDIYPFHPDWAPFRSLLVGKTYKITADGANLNLRKAPALTAEVLKKLPEGSFVTVLEGPVEADGYRWWRISTSDETEGWSVDVWGWYLEVNPFAGMVTPTP